MSARSTRSNGRDEYRSPDSTPRNGVPPSRGGSASSSRRAGSRIGPPSARSTNGRGTARSAGNSARSPLSDGSSPAYNFPNTPGSKNTRSPATYRFLKSPGSRGHRTPNRPLQRGKISISITSKMKPSG